MAATLASERQSTAASSTASASVLRLLPRAAPLPSLVAAAATMASAHASALVPSLWISSCEAAATQAATATFPRRHRCKSAMACNRTPAAPSAGMLEGMQHRHGHAA